MGLISVNNDQYESNQHSVTIGVPQDSILVPIIFLVYINDLTNSSNFRTILYADGTILLARQHR